MYPGCYCMFSHSLADCVLSSFLSQSGVSGDDLVSEILVQTGLLKVRLLIGHCVVVVVVVVAAAAAAAAAAAGCGGVVVVLLVCVRACVCTCVRACVRACMYRKVPSKCPWALAQL